MHSKVGVPGKVGDISKKVTKGKIASQGFNIAKKWFHSTEISNQSSVFTSFAHEIFLLRQYYN